MSKQYESSGVSLTRGYETIKRIKRHVNQTRIPGVIGEFGSFGGQFDLSVYNIPDPILVSGTDGVGTKLLIAQQANRHDTIGIDLVAMCVNDVLTVGAQPMFFLDYIATGKLDPAVVESIVNGVADGCLQAGCALIGGETAEMPDLYQDNHYDLAGFTTGIVSKAHRINSDNVMEGDTLIGLASSGLHSNGYSLVRKILFQDNDHDFNHIYGPFDRTLAEELLEPTKIYVKPVLDVIKQVPVHAIAHITGGGFYENIPRILPPGLGVEIRQDMFPTPTIFSYLAKLGQLDMDEMYHVFNMGIGMILIVRPSVVEDVLAILESHQQDAYRIGHVIAKEGVTIK